MHTTTFLINDHPMPLGIDDIVEFLSQYGHVRFSEDQRAFYLRDSAEGRRKELRIYLDGVDNDNSSNSIFFENFQTKKWEMFGNDLIGAINHYLEN